MSNDIAQLVGTVGFPIVAYLLLFFKLDKTMGMIQESLNNNTLALQELKGERKNV